MNIVEATIKAVSENKWITNTEDEFGDMFFIKPSKNADEGYLAKAKGKKVRPRWQPQACDILSDGWEVVELSDEGDFSDEV